jgi:hypothetical protein
VLSARLPEREEELMTWLEVAKDEAKKFGIELDDTQADHLLWEYTGFPDFWNIPADGATHEECARTQLRRHFQSYQLCGGAP